MRVTCDGQPRSVGSRRQRTLLAALAIRHPRAVAVDELVDAIWEDDPPDRAATTLQTYVSRLRASLGTEAIVHTSAGYRLGDHVEVDAVAARRAVREARDALSTDPVEAADLAQAALAGWDGEPLAEMAASHWFAPAATALAELHDDLIEVAAAGLVAGGRPTQAIDLLQPVLDAHPFREPAQLLLIRALASGGRATEALRAADRYRTRLRDETGLDPGAGLGELEAAILDGQLSPPADPPGPTASPPRHRALPRAERLVGRFGELEELRHRLGSSRLVTVLGTGGVGKTSLVAELLAGPVPAPVRAVVQLATADASSVLDHIGTALGYRAARPDIDALTAVLGPDPSLLVIDNCEHVLAEVRAALQAVLSACPGVRVVATSRTPLALAEEHRFPLQPLATTDQSSAAVELFHDCVRRAGRQPVTGDDAVVVADLCRRLDGLPLAIELAAARAAVLGASTLLDQLSTSTDLLAGPAGSGAGRHTSLRSMIDWSYDLLGDDARRLLAVTSTFEGEFDLEAVDAVGTPVLGTAAAPVFAQLIDTCMVALGSTPGAFRLLEVIRHHAREQLHAGPDEVDARRAHLLWVATAVAAVGQDALHGEELTVAERLDGLRPDARSALRAAVRRGDLSGAARLAGALADLLLYRPHAEQAELILEAVRAFSSGTDPETADLAAAGARAGALVGSLAEAEGLARRALALAPEGPDGSGARCRALHSLGMLHLYAARFGEAEEAFVAVTTEPTVRTVDRIDAYGGAALALIYTGRTTEAERYARQHRAAAETTESTTLLAFAHYIDGERARAAGDGPGAVAALQRAAELAWEAGASFIWGLASTVLAASLVDDGATEAATRQLPLLLQRWRRTATWPQLWTSLRLVAEVLADGRADDLALLLLLAAERDPAAPTLAGADALRLEETKAELVRRLGPHGAADAALRAELLEPRQVLELAIAALDASVAP